MSSLFLHSVQGTTGHRFDVASSAVSKRKLKQPRRSRLGHVFLLQMLMTGTGARSTDRRQSFVSALVEEHAPVRSPLANGVVDDWSGEPARDWDGQELEGASQNLTAIAGLLAVAGAGYFCTKAVGALFNRRTELARIVPHPVAFSASTSSADPTSPRSPLADSRLTSRPLSPDNFTQMEERGTSPIPPDAIHRSTSMGSLATVSSIKNVEESIDQEDRVSMTSAADAIDVASTVSSVESDLAGFDMKDVIVQNRGLPATISEYKPEHIQELPSHFSSGTIRERAQMALRAATAATESAQRAAAFSAAASTASASASKASSQAMEAAALAHIALESGNLEQMSTAQADAWKAAQVAADAEHRAAEAAALATAYEDLAEHQSKMAQELSRQPSMLQTFSATVVDVTSSIFRWCIGAWTYVATGRWIHQIGSLCTQSAMFVRSMCMAALSTVGATLMNVFSHITGFCCYLWKGVQNGVDSSMRTLRVLYARIFNPRGSIGGDATA